MPIRIQRFIDVAMILLSWLTIPFMGWRNISRYFPASMLIFLLTCIDANIGKQRRWWSFYNKPQSFFRDELPFIAGPFLVGSMWILKWTYGNFKRFIFLNAIIDAFFAFLFSTFSRKIKYYRLFQLNGLQFFIFVFYKAFLLYWFQYLFENKKSN